MKLSRGIGLAANQVNVLKRIIVINIDKPYTLINPEITSREGKFKFKEGCLSFPSIFEDIERAQKIEVKAQDENGDPFSFVAEDLLAVCIQHEIDHLDGIVFTRRMSRIKAGFILKKILKKSNN
jgi:peptide deformylase